MLLRGSDISHYQSSIPSGDFCILKATEGLDYVDPSFAGWWKTLGQRGTLRGAYHFAHPDNSPTAEADHFLKVVRPVLRPGDWVVLDHEKPGSSPAHDAAWARAWCAHVEAAVGYSPVVYSFLSFAREGRCAGLGDRPLWIADPSAPVGHPRVPAPWHSWVMHQYSETGGIDHDVFQGTADDWRKLGGLKPTPAPPTPHPSPTPTTEDDMPTGLLLNGSKAVTPISFKRGAYKEVGFIASDVAQGLPVADLKVSVHDIKGWHDSELKVSESYGQPIVKFPDPSTTNGVIVVRADDGQVNVAWEIS